ncbi:hypothetical protein C8J56DRAFT_943662 [Mycena floridula]|nr:hypothetical protein C8J56DRAFT_943662 [Mycena floridula]
MTSNDIVVPVSKAAVSLPASTASAFQGTTPTSLQSSSADPVQSLDATVVNNPTNLTAAQTSTATVASENSTGAATAQNLTITVTPTPSNTTAIPPPEELTPAQLLFISRVFLYFSMFLAPIFCFAPDSSSEHSETAFIPATNGTNVTSVVASKSSGAAKSIGYPIFSVVWTILWVLLSIRFNISLDLTIEAAAITSIILVAGASSAVIPLSEIPIVERVLDIFIVIIGSLLFVKAASIVLREKSPSPSEGPLWDTVVQGLSLLFTACSRKKGKEARAIPMDPMLSRVPNATQDTEERETLLPKYQELSDDEEKVGNIV